MAKRYGVKPSIRKRIISRDGGACQKCGRREPLQVHHIQAVTDNGSDEDSNLITLCTPCHLEWGIAEMIMHIPFDVWLPLPSYGMLCTSFMLQGKCDPSVSARNMYDAIMGSHNAVLAIRSSDMKDIFWGEEDMSMYGPEDCKYMSPRQQKIYDALHKEGEVA